MPPYGEPDWATPGNTSNVATQNAGTPTAATASSGMNGNSSESRQKARWAISLLSFLNFGLAAMMGTLGVLSLIHFNPGSSSDYSAAFLSSYMVIFAVILFLYELIWWTPIAALNKMFRMNFGFMYGLRGKGLFLVFIAFLCLGLRDENASGVKGLDWATGLAWLGAGCFNIFIWMTWSEASAAYKPPTAGLTGPSDSNTVV
ncbi:predicted protein [Phaeodactylum tricornutum CCAP 1055/1]|jgi:hypothetical protein|uniref:Uncharacterized protein n=2 Tax=Phaeodactylum tricornutum TaxID=2850 RepID=B7G112_PHATC|nr:predicted protein [Phaeodactylum tricornutum CCAP 1055/1]EEC47421.1 predicted protein [Phaeodactylum tricornutum CCAP 1055/1]|eukprot:XP_002180769.1 predicted protein [Phaeodactylum tricornutum CCAP 1055/1]